MAYIVQPTNQHTFIDPYSSTIFDMGIEDTRVYLSRQVNYLLSVFGSDCVIRGLDTTTSFSGSVVTVNISPGRAIVDTTLHIFDDPVTLTLDVAPYEDTGYLAVNISYRYIETLQANRPFFKLTWVSSDGNTQLPEPWSPERDRLLLAWIEFTKDGSTNNITNINQHILFNDYTIINNYQYFPSKGLDNQNGTSDFQYSGTPVNGDFLLFDSTSNIFVSTQHTIPTLQDVNLTNLQPNQVLKFDGTKWINVTLSSDLSSLTDTDITNPDSGDYLSFDGTDWINIPFPYNFKVSSNDTIPNFLESKLTSGQGIIIETLNEGANEAIEVNTSFATQMFMSSI